MESQTGCILPDRKRLAGSFGLDGIKRNHQNGAARWKRTTPLSPKSRARFPRDLPTGASKRCAASPTCFMLRADNYSDDQVDVFDDVISPPCRQDRGAGARRTRQTAGAGRPRADRGDPVACARRVDRGGGSGADPFAAADRGRAAVDRPRRRPGPAARHLQARDRQRGGQRRAGDARQSRRSVFGREQRRRAFLACGFRQARRALGRRRRTVRQRRPPQGHSEGAPARRSCPRRRKPCSRRSPPPIRPPRTR